MADAVATQPGFRHRPALRALHWAIALLVFMVWPLGMSLDAFEGELKLNLYVVHESGGFLVLWLMLVRVGVRLTGPVRPDERRDIFWFMAMVVHTLLYVALIVMPVSGFLATNAHGFPFSFAGIIPIPSPIGKAPEIAPIFSAVHFVVARILLVLVVLHLAGVAFHVVIRRDGTLRRML